MTRLHVIEVTGGGPSAWTFEILNEAAWSALSPDEQRAEKRRALKRRQDRRRRAQIQANGPRERFTPEEIGERDDWICSVCLDPVDPAWKAPDPRSPSIDHVRPVAGGGTDTRDNVHITHLFCNLDKNAYNHGLPAYAKARLAQRVYGTPIPEEVRQALRQHRKARRGRMSAEEYPQP